MLPRETILTANKVHHKYAPQVIEALKQGNSRAYNN